MANELTPLARLGGAKVRGPRVGGGHVTWSAWVAGLAWYLIVVLVLAIPLTIFHPYRTSVGQPAPEDVKAPFNFSVIDDEATRKELDRIPEKLDKQWIYDGEMADRVQQRLQSFLSMLNEDNPSSNEALRAFVGKLENQLGIVIDPSTAIQFQAGQLRKLNPPLGVEQARQKLKIVLDQLFDNYPYIIHDKVLLQAHMGPRLKVISRRGLTMPSPELSHVLWWPQEVRDYLAATDLPGQFPGPALAGLRQASLELLMTLLGPTLEYDREAYERDYLQAYLERQKKPVEKEYKTDELIVKKGEPLSELQVDALEHLNEINRNTMAIKIGGIVMITAVFFAAVGFYLARFRRDMTLGGSTVTLLVLPPLIAIAAGQVMVSMKVGDESVMLWFPSAMVGLLASILMSPQLAFVLTLAGACLFGVVTGQELSFLAFALFSGFTAVFASRRVRARGEVLMVGVQVGLVNMITLIILHMLRVMRLTETDWRASIAWAFFSGIACAFGTLVLLVMFERMFGIVTDLRLLELTGLRNPLISQFEEKAAGSYQHVLNVVKLAEAAAQAIGANYLLVRAGAYFHDIGKMIKPKYFSENQVTLDDKKAHSRLSPYMSVLIIKNHVKEGIELARRYHLPAKVVDFIPQHHGTGLIRYFYSEAMKRWAESGAVDEPREEDFRYPGPKPQSIEAAIVMLADSVEAVASSKFTGGQVGEGELRKLVQTAITDKFDDGQFDECDLTMRHLHLIRESFVKTLMGRFHFRVAYPTLPPKREGAAPARESREPAIAISGPGGS